MRDSTSVFPADCAVARIYWVIHACSLTSPIFVFCCNVTVSSHTLCVEEPMMIALVSEGQEVGLSASLQSRYHLGLQTQQRQGWGRVCSKLMWSLAEYSPLQTPAQGFVLVAFGWSPQHGSVFSSSQQESLMRALVCPSHHFTLILSEVTGPEHA